MASSEGDIKPSDERVHAVLALSPQLEVAAKGQVFLFAGVEIQALRKVRRQRL